ncbi:hypothetical protein PF010_g29640 [Phytophthora fragariae]|uniref:Ankyrin repeat protein n=1 Tax=Phytophthora fragariae TaxID=53985 RepID=A0A6G0JNA4_9STRA|nr:hypothetical protein PF010_g29640 [Phytophthora fragariae]
MPASLQPARYYPPLLTTTSTPTSISISMPRAARRPPPPSPPLLASVAFVCRQWPRVEALDHVTRELDALLDCSQLWTLARASGAGLEHLVARIAARDAQILRRMDKLQRQALATTAMAAAAANGHVAVLRLLAEQLFPCARVTKAVETAARNGQVEVLQWLHERQEALDVFWGAREMLVAVRGGHLDVAQWLHRHTSPPEHQFLIDEAARNGDLVMIQWLHGVGAADECTVNAVANAAENGHLETLKWLTEHCFHKECPSIRMDQAAANGHIEAVAEGHLEILEWLFLHYPEPIPSGRLLRIAKRHDLYCVDWLVRTGKAVDYDMW